MCVPAQEESGWAMENNMIKTVAFGGFDKQDVVQYIERTAREAAEIQKQLQEEKARLEESLAEAQKELAAMENEVQRLRERTGTLEMQLHAECAARKELEALKPLVEENEALRADSEAYAAFRHRIGAIECEARKRAADMEEETAARMRQALDIFRRQYQILMNTFESTAAHVTGELRKIEVNLTQLPRAMDQSGFELNELAAVLEKFQSEIK